MANLYSKSPTDAELWDELRGKRESYPIDADQDEGELVLERLSRIILVQRKGTLRAALLDATLEPAIERKRVVASFYFRQSLAPQRSTSARSFQRDMSVSLSSFSSLARFLAAQSEGPEPSDRRVIQGPRSGQTNAADETDVTRLQARVRMLEQQLRGDKLHLRLYRLGAGSFMAGAFSMCVWLFTGVGAPFHPAFSALIVPISIVVMGMSFALKPGQRGK